MTPLDLAYDHGPLRFIFKAPELLGCDDMRILQAVVALAHDACAFVDPRTSTESALRLRNALELTGGMADEQVLLVATSLAALAATAGYSPGRGGAMGKQLRAALRRLAATNVTVCGPATEGSWRMIAWDENGSGRDRLRIVVNPQLGCCAKAMARFAQIDLCQARSLSGDLGRLLHQRLSGWIDHSREKSSVHGRRVRWSTLMTYAWELDGQHGPSPAAIRQRRSNLKQAMEQLRKAGWDIQDVPDRKDMLNIARSARGVLCDQAA